MVVVTAPVATEAVGGRLRSCVVVLSEERQVRGANKERG